MSPSFPTNNFHDGSRMNGIFFCQHITFRAIRIFFPNFYYLTFNQLGFLSVLFKHVHGVFMSSSEEKMGWIYAQPVVTCMANAKMFFYVSIIEPKRNSMGKLRSLFSLGSWIKKNHSSISVFHFCASPYPTFFSFIKFRIKSALNSLHYLELAWA